MISRTKVFDWTTYRFKELNEKAGFEEPAEEPIYDMDGTYYHGEMTDAQYNREMDAAYFSVSDRLQEFEDKRNWYWLSIRSKWLRNRAHDVLRQHALDKVEKTSIGPWHWLNLRIEESEDKARNCDQGDWWLEDAYDASCPARRQKFEDKLVEQGE